MAPIGARRSRALEVLDFVARHGIVTIEHVMAAFDVGRTAGYRHVASCVEAGQLERVEFPFFESGFLRATRLGLRCSGLGLSPVSASLVSLPHRLCCVSVALLLAEEFGGKEVLSERELILRERVEESFVCSALLPGRRRHRPDLAVLTDEGVIAIEVELTPKAPRRLETIIAGWRDARCVTEVRYYCEAGVARRAVERAIERVGAADRVRVFEAPR
jgi:hypothetical protein